jgi:cytochrome c oxidase subunit I+III
MIVVNLVISYRRAEPAGDDPFGGDTLEWSVSSPPPAYNFPVIPKVTSPYAMWDREDREGDARRLEQGDLVLEGGHETPSSTILDGDWDEILDMPSVSWTPFLVSITLLGMFIMLLSQHYAVALGFAVLTGLVLAAWHWKEPQAA